MHRSLHLSGHAFRGILCLVFLLCSFETVLAQVDSAKKEKPKEDFGRQLRIGLDISRPIINLVQDTRKSYEVSVDYYLKKEVYAVVEGGFGHADYEYPDLSYRTNNSFVRIGIDRTLIKRIGPGDWDAAFFGARYCVGFINRTEASYTIVDSVWGSTSGTIAGKSFAAHWAEITGGVRVELVKGLFAGWNVRGRFLLNGRSFTELSPVFIAGYGRGDKTTVFDFNFYLNYAIRWSGRQKNI
jgi:hypothetical protein